MLISRDFEQAKRLDRLADQHCVEHSCLQKHLPCGRKLAIWVGSRISSICPAIHHAQARCHGPALVRGRPGQYGRSGRQGRAERPNRCARPGHLHYHPTSGSPYPRALPLPALPGRRSQRRYRRPPQSRVARWQQAANRAQKGADRNMRCHTAIICQRRPNLKRTHRSSWVWGIIRRGNQPS